MKIYRDLSKYIKQLTQHATDEEGNKCWEPFRITIGHDPEEKIDGGNGEPTYIKIDCEGSVMDVCVNGGYKFDVDGGVQFDNIDSLEILTHGTWEKSSLKTALRNLLEELDPPLKPEKQPKVELNEANYQKFINEVKSLMGKYGLANMAMFFSKEDEKKKLTFASVLNSPDEYFLLEAAIQFIDRYVKMDVDAVNKGRQAFMAAVHAVEYAMNPPKTKN